MNLPPRVHAMRIQPLKFQQGAATILMSVLVGFSITAMGVALMFNVQNAQDKQTTAQAQVNAQSAAWAASEGFRQWLAIMGPQLPGFTITASPAPVPAPAIQVIPTQIGAPTPPNAAQALQNQNATQLITMNFQVVDSQAQVGTTLQVVYGVSGVAGSDSVPELEGSMYEHHFKSEGTNITISAPAGGGGEGDEKKDLGEAISVNGNVDLGASAKGISSARITGNVTMEGNVLRELYANGTVSLQGDAKVVDKLVGLEGVNINQGFAGSVFSNKNIYYKASDPIAGGSKVVTQVAARGSVTIENLKNLEFRDIGSLTTTTLSGCDAGACFKKAEAVGVLKADPAKMERAYSRASITCDSSAQPGTEALAPSFGATCGTKAPTKFKVATPALAPIPILDPIALKPLPIDVWDRQNDANYVVVRRSPSLTLVTVKNVSRNGVALDGEFEFVRSGTEGLLCPRVADVTTSGCTTADVKNVFCTDGCWEANAETGSPGAAPVTFYLKGRVAPGVILFDGNLNLKETPRSAAALLAAGYIRTEGNTGEALALNFAGPNGFTGATGNLPGVSLPGVCTKLANKALNLLPTNFCTDKGYDSAAANNLGNIALMAGGQRRTVTRTTATFKTGDTASEASVDKPGTGGRIGKILTKVIPDQIAGITTTDVITKEPYSGGDIQLAAKNIVYGSILAGNLFRSEGETTIYGFVVSSALAKSPSTGGGGVFNDGGLNLPANYITAKTTFDHTVTSEHFKPGQVPGTGGGTKGVPGGAVILRARYL